MAAIEDLLEPIPGDNPAGQNLRYAPVSDQIREARRAEEDLSQGVWKREIKKADYPLAIKLCREALTKKGKDLQVAAWLTECLTYSEGYPGLKDGLDLIHGLLERFWDTVHPQMDEDGDLELRATPLMWVASQIDRAVRSVPLASDGTNWFDYHYSKSIPTEAEASSQEKKARRADAVAQNKPTPEKIEESFAATPVAELEQLSKEMDAVKEAIERLGSFCDEKFGDVAPNFGPLRDQVVDVGQLVRIQMVKKRSAEPAQAGAQPKPVKQETPPAPVSTGSMSAAAAFGDTMSAAAMFGDAPVSAAAMFGEPAPVPAAAAFDDGQSTAVVDAPDAEDPFSASALWEESDFTPVDEPEPPKARRSAAARRAPAGEPTTSDEAIEQVIAAAEFLRRDGPANPVPYLLLRALRWGEVYSSGEQMDEALLEAPPTEIRVELRQLQQNGDAEQLLEAAERAMAMPCGRGWLDVQRYVLRACEMTGWHDQVARAVRSYLRTLLRDYPKLPEATLNDDTPAATAETRQWLRQQNLLDDNRWSDAPNREVETSENGVGQSAPPDAYDLAMEAARSGRMEDAFSIMSLELSHERSGRGRFLRKLQLARICLATGNAAIGLPILQELDAEVERRQLEDWEESDLIGQLLSMLYRTLGEQDQETRQALYSRLCRLDPVRALGLAK